MVVGRRGIRHYRPFIADERFNSDIIVFLRAKHESHTALSDEYHCCVFYVQTVMFC